MSSIISPHPLAHNTTLISDIEDFLKSSFMAQKLFKITINSIFLYSLLFLLYVELLSFTDVSISTIPFAPVTWQIPP